MRKTTSGFTIVELLIVIVVIAILAAISIVAYNGIQARARTAAHQQATTQTERQIMAYATLHGADIGSISDTLVGQQEGVGSRLLLRPLTGTPDITMYAVCTVNSLAGNWQNIAALSPRSANHQFQLTTSGAGDNIMGYRMDTSAHSNAANASAPVRIVGNTIIGWMQASGGATARAYGYNQAAPHSSASLSPGTGWNFTTLDAGTSTCTQHIALVFNAAHDQTTRAAVIGWLAEKYNVAL